MTNPLRVLEAARSVIDDVNAAIDAPGKRLISDEQLREAAGSIAANIREASGRRAGAERNQFLRYARGSAEETDEWLHTNYRNARIPPVRYWRLHNRIATIVKMLSAMMA